MTNELKPCPFCGSEAKLWEYPQALHTYINPKETTYYKAKCMNPKCGVWHPSWDDPQVAIDRWNTRAERMCHPVPKFNDDSPWPVMVCSECGRPICYDEDENCALEYVPYCCCGAKVVYDD